MSYQILGRAVKNEHLALLIYSTVFGGVYLATRGGPKTVKPTTVQQARDSVLLKADSSDEEKFIMDYIREAEQQLQDIRPRS